MRDTQRIDTSMIRGTVLTIVTLTVAISMTACSHAMMIHGTAAKRPAASEFGLGPRPSAGGRYVAALEFIVTGEHTLTRAYNTPSLRNVAERAPYMDAGQFATLAEVLDHDNRATAAATRHSELRPLSLKFVELRQLEAFLRTLSGPIVSTLPPAWQ